MRIQVNLSEEMNKKAESYSKQFGVSKSQLCSMIIGQGLLSYDKAFDIIGGMQETAKEQLSNALETIDNK